MIIIEEFYSLKSYNTFGVQAYTRIFAEADNSEDLSTVINIFREDNKQKLILGGGSNLLFTDDFDGVVIFPCLKGHEVVKHSDKNVWVRAYSGENWDDFVAYCVSNHWGGLENLSYIPGNVGGCPVQNIGAYGVEVKDVIDSVEVIDLQTGETKIFNNAECTFGYRDSIFKREAKNKYLISSVIFRLSKEPVFRTNYADVTEELKKFEEINIASVRQAIINIRRRKLPDPEELGNAGSFFKNPVLTREKYETLKNDFSNLPFYDVDELHVKVPAAWLIQHCGWKGKREGNVGTYETQPLVIVKYGEATGLEILEFARKIQDSVKQRFDILLDMEVNIV